MQNNLDDTPYWDHETGRWLCSDTSDALDAVANHPGDHVYLYDRDRNGNMINIRMYWSPSMTTVEKRYTIKHGKVRYK